MENKWTHIHKSDEDKRVDAVIKEFVKEQKQTLDDVRKVEFDDKVDYLFGWKVTYNDRTGYYTQERI